MFGTPAQPLWQQHLVDRYGTPIRIGTEILYMVGGDRPQLHDATVVGFTDNSVMVERRSWDWQSKQDITRRIRLQAPPAQRREWDQQTGEFDESPYSEHKPARLPYTIVHGTVIRRLDD